MFLKPNSDVIKLGDFGLSRTIDSNIGGTRDFVGTDLYFAPEVVQQNGNGVFSDNKDQNKIPLVTFTVDVWALGIIAFELLTG